MLAQVLAAVSCSSGTLGGAGAALATAAAQGKAAHDTRVNDRITTGVDIHGAQRNMAFLR